MNVAFAGLRHGHIFTLHKMVRGHEKFKILGAFEEDKEACEKATLNGLPCCYQSYEELLSDDRVETVVLGGCYGDRGEMAIQALKAGKHVIADKPLCTSLKELDKIEKLAEQTGKVVSCMYTMRFDPKINAVKRLVQSGALGEINNVYFGGQHPLMYGRRPMWYFEKDKHGGVINDIGIHGIDALDYMLGLQLEHINAARCWNRYADKETDFQDSAQFMLTAQNGAGILADVSYAIPDGIEFDLPYYWQFYIWGTKGTLRFSLSETTLRVKEKQGETARNVAIEYYVQGNKQALLLQEEPPTEDYLSDFLHMAEGRMNIVLPMKDVLASARKTLLIQETAVPR